jgi:hypothetical protein
MRLPEKAPGVGIFSHLIVPSVEKTKNEAHFL